MKGNYARRSKDEHREGEAVKFLYRRALGLDDEGRGSTQDLQLLHPKLCDESLMMWWLTLESLFALPGTMNHEEKPSATRRGSMAVAGLEVTIPTLET